MSKENEPTGTVERNISRAEQLKEAGADPSLVANHERECLYIAYRKYEEHAKKLLGSVLTIIDAAVNDPRQNKAVKDLIKVQFHKNQASMVTDLADGSICETLDGSDYSR